MRLWWILLLLVACMAHQPQSLAQSLAQSVRVAQGIVLGSDDQPQANAVVYLQNQKTQEVRTYITEADGHYRFGQLSSDADYQLWAEYKGRKSKTRTISSFDSKKEFNFNLKIDTQK
jgi:Carboxypeptidase regulatory-like domain